MPVLVEACVDSVDSAMAAQRGGARRLELCANLSDGGTTPSAGMIAAVKGRVDIPVFAIVRARGGSFVHSESELDVMRRDLDAVADLGADGVVIGVLTPDGSVDGERTRELVRRAAPLPVTFHRAFDLTPAPMDALEALIDVGVARVLTSGGARTAVDGAQALAMLVERAGERLVVMAGGGVREESMTALVQRSGVCEVHVRGTRLVHGPRPAGAALSLRKALPTDEAAWEETDEARIRTLVALANV